MHPEEKQSDRRFYIIDGPEIHAIDRLEDVLPEPIGTNADAADMIHQATLSMTVKLSWWQRIRLRRFLRKTQRAIRRSIKQKEQR